MSKVLADNRSLHAGNVVKVRSRNRLSKLLKQVRLLSAELFEENSGH